MLMQQMDFPDATTVTLARCTSHKKSLNNILNNSLNNGLNNSPNNRTSDLVHSIKRLSEVVVQIREKREVNISSLKNVHLSALNHQLIVCISIDFDSFANIVVPYKSGGVIIKITITIDVRNMDPRICGNRYNLLPIQGKRRLEQPPHYCMLAS